ncbi:MAG: hypothetical protein AB1480_02800 [Nitrospirota bacterium]
MNTATISENNPGIFLKKIRLSFCEINNEASLLKLVNEFIVATDSINVHLQDPSFKKEFVKTLTLLRDKIFFIFINRLNFDMKFFRLYTLFDSQKVEMPPHRDMIEIKNRLLFRYSKADDFSKAKILFLIFLIDIFNQNKNKGFEDFLIRFADIGNAAKEFLEVIDILDITPDDVMNIFIRSGILSSDSFMNKPITVQKRNLIVLLRLWSKFNAPICYAEFYDPLKTLFYEAIKMNNIELVLYIGFFIRFYYGNLRSDLEAWKRLDNDIEKPMSDFFVRYCRTHEIQPCIKKPEKDQKIKVGYAYQQLYPSSPVFVLLSLLKGHMLRKNSDFEFYVYSYDYIEKMGDNEKTINAIESMGIKCVSSRQLGVFNNVYYSHFEKAMALRKRIIKDEIDIFITTGTQIGNFLVSSRVAPVQIYWSHIDPYWSVNNLDYRMVHSSKKVLTEEPYAGIEYFKFPNLMAPEILNPPVSPKKIGDLRGKFPGDKILLGFIGQLHKVNREDYLFAVSEILRRNPETVFLICGYGDKEPIARYFEQAGCINRVYFEGQINSHIYGHVIDIVLDSFPNPMGAASMEFFAKGKPMVSMETDHEEANKFRLKEVHANSIEEYIEIADSLIRNKDYRDEIGRKYRDLVEKELDCQRAAQELEKLYKNLIEKPDELK